jgi:hypothetical protein
MISRFIFNLIKYITFIAKKLNLNRFIHDKILFYIGLNQLSENRKLYKSVKNIQEIELKIFSQNGEDGIIDYILNQLKLIPNCVNFIEIGVGDYWESNTRFIYNSFHPKGLIIDCIENMESRIKKNVNFWKGDLRVCNKIIDSNNIIETLKNQCDFEIKLIIYNL